MLKRALLACLCISCCVSRQASGQSREDTTAVLDAVGRAYRREFPVGEIAILVTPPWQKSRDSAPRADPDLSEIMAKAGRIPLLKQQPESPCRASLSREQQANRPWLVSSLFLHSIRFMGDTAQVRTYEDTGTNACQRFRGVAEWTYFLMRADGVWRVVVRQMTRVS